MRFEIAKKSRRWKRCALGGALAALLALAVIWAPDFGPVRECLQRRFRGVIDAPRSPGSRLRRISLPETPVKAPRAAFSLGTGVFTGRPPPSRSAVRSPFRRLVDRLVSVACGDIRAPGRKWEIADVVYDPEEGKKGATVRSAWSDRLFSIYGLALRPAGIDQVLGLEYRLIDSLIIGHQREFRLDEGREADSEGESKVYLRWQKEF